jgi:hypothetical protein
MAMPIYFRPGAARQARLETLSGRQVGPTPPTMCQAPDVLDKDVKKTRNGIFRQLRVFISKPRSAASAFGGEKYLKVGHWLRSLTKDTMVRVVSNDALPNGNRSTHYFWMMQCKHCYCFFSLLTMLCS